jgi:two-component system response regulator RegX3
MVEAQSNVKILVVEDDRSVRETLGIVLESYGYDAHLVEDGKGTMASLEKRWPDVMLLDLTLNEMTGEELYKNIKERFQSVPPTVVLSAVQHGESRIQGMDGAKFLAKPYTLEQLISMVQQVATSRKAA